eukprot:867986-Pyramimonas_sp.AAC.1
MNDVNLEWVDFRDGKKYPLRVRGDLPLHARQEKGAFSGLACDALTKLQASRSWAGGCKFG